MSQGRRFENFSEASGFLWSIADLLRGDYKQHDYGKVILPFTVLRRLDCVLEPTKKRVLARRDQLAARGIKSLGAILNTITGVPFHNISKLTFSRLTDDPSHIRRNLVGYVEGFSDNAREIFLQRFKLGEQVEKLDDGNLLFQVVSRFAEVDLHPEAVDNHMMGLIFEDLIRRFAEQSNETAGEHFTPREVIRLMVRLLFMEDREALAEGAIVKQLYDPACGTGGMLSVAQEYLHELNPEARLEVFGQELNDESYAICNADMMLKGQNPNNIQRGNSFSDDGHAGKHFAYMLSNPPFGVEWKKVAKVIRDEHDNEGFAGRFGPGLPRINDGSLLFLMHMMSKMLPAADEGCRLAIVFNGSPLFTGDAGSGESEIRRWLLENDLLEAIVALPDQLFFNTGILTYVWVVTNRKLEARRGKVQLIQAVGRFEKMRKSLGNKRNQLGAGDIEWITELYGAFAQGEHSKIFANEDFGFQKITVERPLQLNFQVSDERLARLDGERGFANLGKSRKRGAAGEKEMARGRAMQARVHAALETMDSESVWTNRDEFAEVVRAVFREEGVKVTAAVHKAVLSALSERDEEADVCVDRHGEPVPDPELRDTENVPLAEEIDGYFAREVLPHVPDAWVDESKTKIGYEIPFTRHFYKYEPLRPLVEIEAEIRSLEAEIQGMLEEALV